ncbi:MAG: Gmad2 immunoglobulin-like domain-containing protein [Acidimicrobiia bacterium]
MPSARLASLLVVPAVLLAACGTAGPEIEPGAEPTPTVTVTVTEHVTLGDTDDTDDTGDTADTDVASCSEDLSMFAFIYVASPTPGSRVQSPFTVEGCSNTFEANVLYRLLGEGGDVLAEGFTTADCGSGCVGTYSFDVEFEVEEAQVGTLEVFDESAEDGSEQLMNRILLFLEP